MTETPAPDTDATTDIYLEPAGASPMAGVKKLWTGTGLVAKLVAGGVVLAVVGVSLWLTVVNGTGEAASDAAASPTPSVDPQVAIDRKFQAKMGGDLDFLRGAVFQWNSLYEEHGYPPMRRFADYMIVAGEVEQLEAPGAEIKIYGDADDPCFESTYLPPGSTTGVPVVTSMSSTGFGNATYYDAQPCPANFVARGEAELPTQMPHAPIASSDYFAAPNTCIAVGSAPVGYDGKVVDTIEVVECSSEHDYEIIAVGWVSGDDYPGAQAMNDYVVPLCEAAMLEYSGREVFDGERLYSWYGDEENWDWGYREYECGVTSEENYYGGSIRK